MQFTDDAQAVRNMPGTHAPHNSTAGSHSMNAAE